MPKIVPNLLDFREQGGDSTFFDTNTYFPSANRTVLLFTYAIRLGLPPPPPIIPAVSGNNLTWVLVASQLFAHGGVDRARISIFRAVGPAPTSGVTRVQYAITQLRHATTVIEFANTDIGNLGANAIVGTPPSEQDDPGTLTPSIILPAAEDPENASLGILAYGEPNPIVVPGVGITVLKNNPTTEGGGQQVQFTQSPVTLMDWTLSGIADAQAQIAIELRNATPSGPAAGPQILGRPAFVSGNLIT